MTIEKILQWFIERIDSREEALDDLRADLEVASERCQSLKAELAAAKAEATTNAFWDGIKLVSEEDGDHIVFDGRGWYPIKVTPPPAEDAKADVCPDCGAWKCHNENCPRVSPTPPPAIERCDGCGEPIVQRQGICDCGVVTQGLANPPAEGEDSDRVAKLRSRIRSIRSSAIYRDLELKQANKEIAVLTDRVKELEGTIETMAKSYRECDTTRYHAANRNVEKDETIAELRGQLETAERERDEANRSKRWNVERSAAGITVCFNNHDKSEPCQPEQFVPVEQLTVAHADAARLRGVIETAYKKLRNGHDKRTLDILHEVITTPSDEPSVAERRSMTGMLRRIIAKTNNTEPSPEKVFQIREMCIDYMGQAQAAEGGE